MKRALAMAGILAGLGAVAQAQTEVTGTLKNDRWYYPFNATPGSRTQAGIFSFFDGGASGFKFNYRDGQAMIQWELEIPTELQSSSFFVSAARIEFYDSKNATWTPGDGDIEAFAAGFGPTYSEATWTGTETYIGGNPSVLLPRDPYPRNLGTNTHAEDDLNATPWGIGTAAGYTGSTSEAFKVVIDLNVYDPDIQAELQADLASGLSSWLITATFPGAQPGPGPQPSYPNVILSEGVGDTSLGTVQQAPALILELSTAASARNWNLYE
jgi:hypothetical protein